MVGQEDKLYQQNKDDSEIQFFRVNVKSWHLKKEFLAIYLEKLHILKQLHHYLLCCKVT